MPRHEQGETVKETTFLRVRSHWLTPVEGGRAQGEVVPPASDTDDVVCLLHHLQPHLHRGPEAESPGKVAGKPTNSSSPEEMSRLAPGTVWTTPAVPPADDGANAHPSRSTAPVSDESGPQEPSNREVQETESAP
jgi:hypothetical protein